MTTAGISDKVLWPLVAALAAGLVLVGAGLAFGAEVVWQTGLAVIGTGLAGAGVGFKAPAAMPELDPERLDIPEPAESVCVHGHRPNS